MRQMHAVRLLVATGLVAAVVPSGVRSVSAAPTVTKGVCVMVAKKPCTTRQSVRHGVPKVLQSGRSATLSSLAATTRKTKLSATVRTSSRSRCAIKSGRLVAKKTTGDCAVSITARTGNRVVVYDLSVLVVR